jgi:hypothetical protein
LNVRRYHPAAQRAVDPIGYRDSSNVAALPKSGRRLPVLFALLQVIDR